MAAALAATFFASAVLVALPITFFATVGAIIAVGARPVFVDIDDRYQIDVSLIDKSITPQTKAILPVHWGGASPDMKTIMEKAQKWGLKVVEDACMVPGGYVHNRHAGTMGNISAWSMHPLKPLNVMGDGGMVSTDDDELASWMRMYRNHGMVDRNHNSIWGVNMRLQPLQAIVAKNESRTAKYIAELQSYQAEVASVVQEYTQNLQGDGYISARGGAGSINGGGGGSGGGLGGGLSQPGFPDPDGSGGQGDLFSQLRSNRELQINRDFDELGKSQVANLQSRGLGSSSLAGNIGTGIERDKQRAFTDVGTNILDRKINFQQQKSFIII